jgi:hypothetical protein
MRSKALKAQFAIMVFFIAGCGLDRYTPHDGWAPPGGLQSDPGLPKTMNLKGNFEALPVVQIRSLPPSRMVQLQGEAQLEAEADERDLAELLDPSERDDAVWKTPETRGCMLSQIHLTRTRTKPLRFSFLFWGWDKQGGECEALLRDTQTKGFSLVLKRVSVRGRGVIAELRVTVGPLPAPAPAY